MKILLFFTITFLIFPKSTLEKYKSNQNKILEFKKNMTINQWNYYTPRKKYIDKQPIKSSKNYLSQVDIIVKGSLIREKNNWNEKEIKTLEHFLLIADDIELGKYFSLSEEVLLSIKAKNSIQSIQRLSLEDEKWRIKNDPIFYQYLTENSSIEEKIYYKKNKAIFFRKESGEELISFLKNKSSQNQIAFW